MIVETMTTIDGREVKRYTPENEADKRKLRKMIREQNIDTRSSLGDGRSPYDLQLGE